MRRTEILMSSAMVLSLASCGLWDPKVISYRGAEIGATNRFATTIGPAAKSTCATSGCHGAATQIAGAYMSTTDDNTNRQTLLGYIKAQSGGNCQGSSLYSKITGAHGGGPQGATMPLAQIEQWLSTEEECQ